MRPEEVSMRPAEVFVRELAPHEGQRLKRLSKQSKFPSPRRARDCGAEEFEPRCANICS
jgi:hypothetical protein